MTLDRCKKRHIFEILAGEDTIGDQSRSSVCVAFYI